MKTVKLISIVYIFLLTACNNSSNRTAKISKPNDTAQATASTPTKGDDTSSIKSIIAGYLQIKNALANDDGPGAADGGQALADAISHMDTASLTPPERKAFMDIADDIKENAEHCRVHGKKIEHQREHFEMITEDMYSLVKSLDPKETLYYDYCPMKKYNWLSETKEIRNPYFGKKMIDCGSVKEVIK